MGQELKSIWGLIDEREEVIFFLLMTIGTVALFLEFCTATEYYSSMATFYGMLLGKKHMDRRVEAKSENGTKSDDVG